jgi:hypothetical protein
LLTTDVDYSVFGSQLTTKSDCYWFLGKLNPFFSFSSSHNKDSKVISWFRCEFFRVLFTIFISFVFALALPLYGYALTRPQFVRVFVT